MIHDTRVIPADAGVYDYVCHEGNFGTSNMLSASSYLEQTEAAEQPKEKQP